MRLPSDRARRAAEAGWSIRHARDEDAPTGREVRALNVLRRAYGTGLADLLMAALAGDGPAYLWVVDGNDRAAAFYRRHGFADDGGRKDDVRLGVREVRMSRPHAPGVGDAEPPGHTG